MDSHSKRNDHIQKNWEKQTNTYFSDCCNAIVYFGGKEPMCTNCLNECEILDYEGIGNTAY